LRVREYRPAEPGNRLVARELERQWEATLADQARLEQEYPQSCAERPARPTAAGREQTRSYGVLKTS